MELKQLQYIIGDLNTLEVIGLANTNSLNRVKTAINTEITNLEKEIELEKLVKIDDFTRVNNDGNGNPRYVLHFLRLITDKENETLTKGDISGKYAFAVNKASAIGGRKFNNKQYGGGIMFSSYNLQDECDSINELNK